MVPRVGGSNPLIHPRLYSLILNDLWLFAASHNHTGLVANLGYDAASVASYRDRGKHRCTHPASARIPPASAAFPSAFRRCPLRSSRIRTGPGANASDFFASSEFPRVASVHPSPAPNLGTCQSSCSRSIVRWAFALLRSRESRPEDVARALGGAMRGIRAGLNCHLAHVEFLQGITTNWQLFPVITGLII